MLFKKEKKSATEDQPKGEIVEEPYEYPLKGLTPSGLEEPSEENFPKYQQVFYNFKNEDLKLPITEKYKEGDETRSLTTEEKAWLTKECILRYCRACNWNVTDTITRLENSISWRREFGISGGKFQTLKQQLVAPENETGKQLIFGFDRECRPCLFLFSGKQNTKPSFRQIQHLIFMLEMTIWFMPRGQDKLALCVDFKNYPELSAKSFPSVSVGKQVLHILQYHYPERLGRALFVNIPWYAWAFLKICYPFVDPYTKQKCAFDEPFAKFIPEEQLDFIHGGEVNFKYDHEKYWPEMLAIGEKKMKNYMKNFEKLGGTVGLSEYDLRSEDE